ncbi:tetratricopeptide repeat protein [Massilia sp. YIM B02443]|uniref:tetratricopeptide repeat protein n=1 Tax=Massilia sp. YIM B02443 TaxID=3050127 RepID=UPI0025B664B7|nr:tetratricopeptide repeat protein [Massilia sp. YIM B02443]MDN4040103.1 tetratricopeptide repeat protein [Massilia sp. YIM B02443]
MKNAFAIVTLSGLLTACAVAPQQQLAPGSEDSDRFGQVQQQDASNAQAEAAPELDEEEQAAKAKAEEEARLPKVELTPTMLQQLLKAEFAFRNGDWQGPYLTMLSLAQQTQDPRLARRAAEMAVAAKQADDTLAAVRLWYRLDPTSEEATQYFVGMVVTSDNIAELEPVFEGRLRAAPANRRGILMFQVQQLLARAKDKEAAVSMLERLIAPYQGTMEAHIVRAQVALVRGNKAQARTEAQAALAVRPNSEIAVLMLAQVTEDDDAVMRLLDGFLQKYPDAREVRAAQARVLVNRKDYPRARQEFERLLKDQPDNAAHLYALGILATQMNDAPGAERYFTRFVEVLGRNPDDERDPSRALLILSQLAEERGDLAGALQWLDKVPEGTDPQTLFNSQLRRAQLVAKGGDVAGARRLLTGLKPSEPARQAQVAVAEAQLLREANQLQEAYVLMEAAAKRFPKNPDLLYDFALLAEKLGRVEVMEAQLREVMVQAPDNHHAYNALGYSLAERNVRLQEAYGLIAKALEMAPDDPFIMDSMGWVHYRMGNLNEAEKFLRRAYGLRRDPEIAVHLGEVLWQKGEKSAAQQLWREARAKDPDNDTLRTTLARLRLSL